MPVEEFGVLCDTVIGNDDEDGNPRISVRWNDSIYIGGVVIKIDHHIVIKSHWASFGLIVLIRMAQINK